MPLALPCLPLATLPTLCPGTAQGGTGEKLALRRIGAAGEYGDLPWPMHNVTSPLSDGRRAACVLFCSCQACSVPMGSGVLYAALDASADDLRHDRMEDAASFLERVQAKIDSYKAGRATGPGGPEGR